MSGLVAVLDPRRELHIRDAAGNTVLQPAATLLWADWARAQRGAHAHSWPTWSPDGADLAVFRQHVGTGNTHVYVTDAHGTRASELVTLERRLPIHLEWAPGGGSLAMLCQRDRTLVLELLDAPEPGNRVPVASGTPLFYAWMADDRLAVFVGRNDTPSELRVLGGSDGPVVLPGVPGNFCTPVPIGDSLLYVAHRERRVELLHARPGGEVTALQPVDGLMALVPAPDGERVALAIAGRDGAPYTGLAVLDPRTGVRLALADIPLLAFFWSPRGDAVIGAQQAPEGNRVTWFRLGLDGTKLPLFEHLPSRDLAFWLRFFEQYCVSHPCVDPDGRHLVVGGYAGEREGESTLWRVPLDGSPAESIGTGVLAVHGPAPTT